MDDELPLPPSEVGVPEEASFSADFDGGLLGEVPGLSDPIPAGVKHFRLDSYKKTIDKDGQPRFDAQWKCQEEPNVGRVLFDFIGWVDGKTQAVAKDPSNLGCKEARALINKRMPRAKEIMAAAGFKPVGNFNFETDFLATHPEVKIPVTISERKNKDDRETLSDGNRNPDFGKYTIKTGQMQNGMPNTYLSVNRPS